MGTEPKGVDINKKNIIVLDDNKNDLLMAKFVILRMGFNPLLIEKSSQLIDTLQLHKTSLIVLDIDMPGLSGLDVLKKIKKVDAYKNIPIVMLTGNSDIGSVKTAISTGALDYIVKPIDPLVFESKVKKLVGFQEDESKNSWVEYQIQKVTHSEFKLGLSVTLISIGEMSLTLKSNQPLAKGLTFSSDSELFKSLEIAQPVLKVDSCEVQGDCYWIKCSLIGLSEADLKKIRLYSQLLISKKIA